ncbi:MAG: sugar phosphate isomerase/epimerase [Candidatus Hydrogenedentes bacterium]|nr:sugar phosphate isomerase/epimerase [Candidatus Hydrogenedentota bacterium]
MNVGGEAMADILTSTTTLGCPDWDLPTIIGNLAEYGYDAVDFRGLNGELDITRMPEFTTGIAETRRIFADAGLRVSAISSSIRICEHDRDRENLEEARRTIAVAQELAVPGVRVFGGGDLIQHDHGTLAGVGVATMDRILALDGATDLTWGFETHDHWIGVAEVSLLLERIPSDRFGVLWDVGHTSRVTREAPAESWAAYGPRVVNTHFKDAVHDPAHAQAMDDGWRYVPLGQGELPLADAVRLLKENGYAGYLTLEHEKRWHPELPGPEEAFPHALRWFREQLCA